MERGLIVLKIKGRIQLRLDRAQEVSTDGRHLINRVGVPAVVEVSESRRHNFSFGRIVFLLRIVMMPQRRGYGCGHR